MLNGVLLHQVAQVSPYAFKCSTAKSLQMMFQADLETFRDICSNKIVVDYSVHVHSIFFHAKAQQRNAHSSDIPYLFKSRLIVFSNDHIPNSKVGLDSRILKNAPVLN